MFLLIHVSIVTIFFIVVIQDPVISFLDGWEDPVTTSSLPTTSKFPENDLKFHVSSIPDSVIVPEISTSSAQSSSMLTPPGYTDIEPQLTESDDMVVNETISLRHEREQLLNELNSLRENQLDVLDRTRREVSSNYEHQVANLQQSLVDTERRLQNVELLFEESKRAFSEQDDTHMQVLAEQSQKHAQDLVDRDQRHAELVSRITKELESRPMVVVDVDEQEAERLKMIKDKLKEIHETEKQKMAAEHSREMELLKEDLQKKLNDYQGQAENAANAQIKVFHQQYMDALRAMEEENRRLNSMLDQVKGEVEHISETAKQEKAALEEFLLETSREEKISLEGNYASLLEGAKMEKVALEEKYCLLLDSRTRDIASSEAKYSLLLETTKSEKVSLEERYASFLESARIEKGSLEEKYASLLEKSKVEKISLQDKYNSLLESCSKEVDQERENKFLVEEQLRDWMEKASQLEAKLVSTETQNEADGAAGFEYEEQVQSLPSLVGEYEAKLSNAEARHQQELKQFHARTEKEFAERMLESQEQNHNKMEEVISKYECQLRQLEANALDECTDKASLDVAEEHMKNLEKQLDKYRNQEQNFEACLAEIKQQHSADVDLIRNQFDAEKCMEVGLAREEVASRIKTLEGQLASLTKNKEHCDVQVTEGLHATHQMEVDELNKVLVSKMETALVDLRCELDASHQQEITCLKQQFAEEFIAEKSKVEKEVREEGEKVTRQSVGEVELNLVHLNAIHQDEVSKLEKSLSQAEKVTSAKFEKKIGELQSHISELESDRGKWESSQLDLLSQLELLHQQRQELEQSLLRMANERKQLSEDCDRFQKRVKTLEMDESITRSAEEHFQKMVEHNAALLDEKQDALDVKGIEVDSLAAQLAELENKVDNLEEKGESRELEFQGFIGQLAAKNQAYADLQVEMDSLKTAHDILRKQHVDDEEACDRLKGQLQNSWGVNEEIEALKRQVMELITYRDNYGDLMVKVESFEEVINCKDDIIIEIKRKLDEASRSLEEASRRGLHYEEENTNYAKQVEVLRNELIRMDESSSGLKQQVKAVESALIERNQVIKDMERVISELETTVERSRSNSQGIAMEASKSEEDIKDLSSRLKVSLQKEKLMLAELQEKEETVKELNSKLTIVLGKDKSRAVEAEKKNEEIDQLNCKLAASLSNKETLQSDILMKEQVIMRLNGLVSEKQKDSSKVDEMNGIIEALQNQVSTLELELSENTHTILDLNHNVDDLEVKLSLANEDIAKMDEVKSKMQLDLIRYQSESQTSDANHEVAKRCSKLEEDLSKACEEKGQLMSELADLRTAQPAIATPNDILEAKFNEQEKTIKDLQALLAAKESSPSIYRVPFDQEFLDDPLGATLTRARKTLVEKLQEKEVIEKELSLRRAKLERQMSEKQRLEDLLFEKKRFEHELQNQKSLLKKELEDLEARNSPGRCKV